VAEPFGLGKATRYEVGGLADAAAVRPSPSVPCSASTTARHEVTTSVGEIGYDILLVAIGAVPTESVPGALTFRGPADTRRWLRCCTTCVPGAIRRVAFRRP
jgi:hypothetical protein